MAKPVEPALSARRVSVWMAYVASPRARAAAIRATQPIRVQPVARVRWLTPGWTRETTAPTRVRPAAVPVERAMVAVVARRIPTVLSAARQCAPVGMPKANPRVAAGPVLRQRRSTVISMRVKGLNVGRRAVTMATVLAQAGVTTAAALT